MSDMEVLDLCIELWTEMRDKKYTSASDKYQTDFARRHPNLGRYSWCACCKQTEGVCEKCILLELWGGETTRHWAVPCVRSEVSPYWSFRLDKGTPVDAQRIIDFCVEKKRELESEEKESELQK